MPEVMPAVSPVVQEKKGKKKKRDASLIRRSLSREQFLPRTNASLKRQKKKKYDDFRFWNVRHIAIVQPPFTQRKYRVNSRISG